MSASISSQPIMTALFVSQSRGLHSEVADRFDDLPPMHPKTSVDSYPGWSTSAALPPKTRRQSEPWHAANRGGHILSPEDPDWQLSQRGPPKRRSQLPLAAAPSRIKQKSPSRFDDLAPDFVGSDRERYSDFEERLSDRGALIDDWDTLSDRGVASRHIQAKKRRASEATRRGRSRRDAGFSTGYLSPLGSSDRSTPTRDPGAASSSTLTPPLGMRPLHHRRHQKYHDRNSRSPVASHVTGRKTSVGRDRIMEEDEFPNRKSNIYGLDDFSMSIGFWL